VKDNHLAGLGVTDAVSRAHALWPGRTVEVECDRAAQVQEAINAGADMVLLDNMTPDEVRACVSLARTTAPAGFLVEVSGGITLDNVRAYADAGADLISTSVITQSAPALDIAFDLKSEEA
jgi:nicotinate-nucleotide pyrophosphorylase (carboxylating)